MESDATATNYNNITLRAVAVRRFTHSRGINMYNIMHYVYIRTDVLQLRH